MLTIFCHNLCSSPLLYNRNICSSSHVIFKPVPSGLIHVQWHKLVSFSHGTAFFSEETLHLIFDSPTLSEDMYHVAMNTRIILSKCKDVSITLPWLLFLLVWVRRKGRGSEMRFLGSLGRYLACCLYFSLMSTRHGCVYFLYIVFFHTMRVFTDWGLSC